MAFAPWEYKLLFVWARLGFSPHVATPCWISIDFFLVSLSLDRFFGLDPSRCHRFDCPCGLHCSSPPRASISVLLSSAVLPRVCCLRLLLSLPSHSGFSWPAAMSALSVAASFPYVFLLACRVPSASLRRVCCLSQAAASGPLLG
jgi:hypothetical protein